MAKGIGNDYGLYAASGSAPSNPAKVSNYDLVGFGTDLTFSRSRNMIDASNKDSAQDSEFISGRRTTQITGTFYADQEDDANAGQDHIEDLMDDATGAVLYWLISDNVAGNKQWYGEALPSQFDVSMPDEGMMQIDVTLQVSGTYTSDAVT